MRYQDEIGRVERGAKHDWQCVLIWDQYEAHCARCGMIGEQETYLKGAALGWRGKPTYGCTRLLEQPEQDERE